MTIACVMEWLLHLHDNDKDGSNLYETTKDGLKPP